MVYSLRWFICSLLLLTILPFAAAADPLLDTLDALNNAGGIENQKRAIELGMKAVAQNPDDYAANWKLARAYAYYTHSLQANLVTGWEDACKVYAQKGMACAEKAMSLCPDKIEGRYFFAFNAGMYSFGISIFGAISEGLKGKTQQNFEKVYEMNKHFEEGDVLISLGRFWHKLPWPLKDKEKALKYYREYQEGPFYGKDPNTMVLVADLLADMGGKKHQQEARKILDTAMECCDEYYREIASEALNRL